MAANQAAKVQLFDDLRFDLFFAPLCGCKIKFK
jgi:hypothetical protein